jgi:multidrug efflux system outer membrane protein
MKHAIALALVVLTGCTLGPDYQRPKVAMPDQFRGAPPAAAGAAAASIADSKWQELFPDETLVQLVNSALQGNFDLQITAERIQEARAQLGIARANQFPFVTAQAGLTGTQVSSVGSNTFVRPGTALKSTYTNVGATLSWEIDLFGRLRRLTEAARANYLASEEGRRAVTVSLVAGVMDTYFQLLEQDAELDISRKTRGSAQDSMRLVELRHERGAVSSLDVRQSEQLLFTAGARMAAAERAIAQTENQLSLLQGRAPEAQPVKRNLHDIPIPSQVPPGLPAAILERRPDIREAEQNLVAANAQIGAARALYFPQISLTGTAGAQSRYLLGLFTAPARTYTVAPQAIQTVFNAGQTRNQVRFSEAQQRELLVNYQRTIYTALREVSDALTGFDRLREERSQQERLVRTLEDTVRLSEVRYRGGLDSYLQVLDAQRNLFTGQLTLAQLWMAERQSVVEIYRSLGGGWGTT